MKTLKTTILFALTIAFGATAWAASYTWDGGGDGTTFDDAANWTPAGSAFNTVDEYTIDDGSAVTVGADFSIGAFDLSNNSSLTIGLGNSVTINTTNATDINSATLQVDGSLDFGSARWNVGGVGETFTGTVNGSLTGSGNFFAGFRMNATLNVNGTVDMKVSRLGGVQSTGVSRIINVNAGGEFYVNSQLTLESLAAAQTAVFLNGGLLDFSAADNYDYSALTIDGNDGIVFTNASSSITLEGDRTGEVNTWITDGALSSQVGSIQVNYDGGLDQTLVAIPEPSAVGLFGVVSLAAIGLRRRSR